MWNFLPGATAPAAGESGSPCCWYFPTSCLSSTADDDFAVVRDPAPGGECTTGGSEASIQRDCEGESPAVQSTLGSTPSPSSDLTYSQKLQRLGDARTSPAHVHFSEVVETVEARPSLSSLASSASRVKRQLSGDDLANVRRVDPRVPFKVVHFPKLLAHGMIPRSDARLAELPPCFPPEDDYHYCFISHRWLRPWKLEDECRANGHEWAGSAHPDNAQHKKYFLIVEGITQLAAQEGWELEKVYVWVDFACVDQDDQVLKMASIDSILGYMSMCEFVLVPTIERPKYPQVHSMTGEYKARAWTRLEAFGFYVLALMKSHADPKIWNAAYKHGEASSLISSEVIVEKIVYVIQPYLMPHTGVLYSERDRKKIKEHEETMLRYLHKSACDGMRSAFPGAMVAAAGLGHKSRLQGLLDEGIDIDTQDRMGITALWSAARNNQSKCAEYLLEQGADVNLANYVEQEQKGAKMTPLHCAAQEGDLATVEVLLLGNADVNLLDKHEKTPLLTATFHGQCSAVEALLKFGDGCGPKQSQAKGPTGADVATSLKLSECLRDVQEDSRRNFNEVAGALRKHLGRYPKSRQDELRKQVSEDLINALVAKKKTDLAMEAQTTSAPQRAG